MASRVRTIMTALIARLNTINGSGSYAYDLSATDSVKVGVPTGSQEGIHLPAVWLDFDLPQTDGPDLAGFMWTLEIRLVAVCAATTQDPGERKLVASDLWDDIVTAITADRRLGSTVDTITVRRATFDGGTWGAPELATVRGQLVATWIGAASEGP